MEKNTKLNHTTWIYITSAKWRTNNKKKKRANGTAEIKDIINCEGFLVAKFI